MGSNICPYLDGETDIGSATVPNGRDLPETVVRSCSSVLTISQSTWGKWRKAR